jgi:hypothetical protein
MGKYMNGHRELFVGSTGLARESQKSVLSEAEGALEHFSENFSEMKNGQLDFLRESVRVLAGGPAGPGGLKDFAAPPGA